MLASKELTSGVCSWLTADRAPKFGVIGVTESLARELAGEDVRVYAVCPERMATDMSGTILGARVGVLSARVTQAIIFANSRLPAASGGYWRI